MKNKKGFTLIELLAVIAILAIILVIAVPQVLGTLAKSRQNSAVSSAQMAWGAAELHVATATLEGTSVGASVAVGDLTTMPSSSSVKSGTFTVANGQITGIGDTLEVTSGGQNFDCTGATKSAIACTLANE